MGYADRTQRIQTQWFGVRTQDGGTNWGRGVPVGFEATERIFIQGTHPDEREHDVFAETGSHFIDAKHTPDGRRTSLWCPNPRSCLLCVRRNELDESEQWKIPTRKSKYYYQVWRMDADWALDAQPTNANQSHLAKDGNMYPMVWCANHNQHIAIQAALQEYKEKTKAWAVDGFDAFDSLHGCPLEVKQKKVDNRANGLEFSVSIWQPPGHGQFTYYPLPEKWMTHEDCLWKLQRFCARPSIDKQNQILSWLNVGPSIPARAPVIASAPAAPPTPQATPSLPTPPAPPAPPQAMMQPPVAPPAPQPVVAQAEPSRPSIPASLMMAPVQTPPPQPVAAPPAAPPAPPQMMMQAPQPVAPVSTPQPRQPVPQVTTPQNDKQDSAAMFRKLFSQGRSA